jgi:hypothetical protein
MRGAGEVSQIRGGIYEVCTGVPNGKVSQIRGGISDIWGKPKKFGLGADRLSGLSAQIAKPDSRLNQRFGKTDRRARSKPVYLLCKQNSYKGALGD